MSKATKTVTSDDSTDNVTELPKGKKFTPSFIVELPLVCNTHQAKILRSRFEAARNLYNALLSEAVSRLKTLRNSPEWKAARAMPAKSETERETRQKAFTAAKAKYGFTEFPLVNFMPNLRVSWLASHVDSSTGQKLATRAFSAVERVCYGKARKVRFKSIGRGLDSIEGRDNDSGLHFYLVDPVEEKAKAAEKKKKKKTSSNSKKKSKAASLPVVPAQVTTESSEATDTAKEIKPESEEPKRLVGYLVWRKHQVKLKPDEVAGQLKKNQESAKNKAKHQADKLAATYGRVMAEPEIKIETALPTHRSEMFRIPLLIDWKDELVKYSLEHRVKFVRILRKKATSTRAKGADCRGYHYFIQLVLEGVPYKKQPKPKPAKDRKAQSGDDITDTSSWAKSTIGLDLGPQTIAIASQDGTVARLEQFCSELTPDAKAKRRLQRKLDRQRRASNPANYDEKGRIKKGNEKLNWKYSKSYQITRQRLASQERRLAEHRKSQHGRLANEIAWAGSVVKLEKIEYKAWQKMFGKSVGVRAPGKFVEILKRTVARTGGTFLEFPTRSTKLSQACHGCGTYIKKPLSQRWHKCECGVGPVQRDLYSSWLASFVELVEAEANTKDTGKKAKAKTKQEYTLSVAQCRLNWEGVELRLVAATDSLQQRANEGYQLPRSVGLTSAGARRPKK